MSVVVFVYFGISFLMLRSTCTEAIALVHFSVIKTVSILELTLNFVIKYAKSFRF